MKRRCDVIAGFLPSGEEGKFARTTRQRVCRHRSFTAQSIRPAAQTAGTKTVYSIMLMRDPGILHYVNETS